jgi:hypothetical protein
VSETRSADDLYKDPQDAPEVLPAFLKEPPKTNDPKQLRIKATDDKARELKQQNDIRSILTTESGIRFMARLLCDICYIDQSAFHPNNSTMCNIAGRRQVGQQIKELIRDCDFELWVKVDRVLEEMRPKSSAKGRSMS